MDTTSDDDSQPHLSHGRADAAEEYISNVTGNRESSRCTKSKPLAASEETVEWSSDDDAGADAYAQFKKRKSLKRKRAAASTRKVKERAQNVSTGTQSSFSGEKPSRNLRKYGDASGDDDTLLEESLPDYLKTRRSTFDQFLRKQDLDGLATPPTFEEVEFSDDEHLESLEERPSLSTSPYAEYSDIELPNSGGVIPASIAQRLREYQVHGASFLHELFVYQKGGILGDDMGLGKTVQVIAFLTAAFGKTGDERDLKRMRKMRRAPGKPWYPKVIVICPGTLIENWKAELRTWGWWHVDVYHGFSKAAAIEAARSGRLEIMITTYTTFRLKQDLINMIEWDCVIADECHTIKERSAEITQAMNNINALCRIGLTGTAIQNKYDELWTLLNWTNPGHFGPISVWRETISNPLRIGQSHDATVYELSRARKTAKKLVENLLPEFFLRRMKSLIAHQLPTKSDKVVFCPLTQTQREAYERYLGTEIIDLIRTCNEPCPCDSRKSKGWCCFARTSAGDKWQSFVFPALINLQKISNHLAILIPQGTDPKDKQTKDLITLKAILPNEWHDLYESRDSIIHFANPGFCGKWNILKKLLAFWHDNGDKVLVFSHSVRLLKMLGMLLTHTSYNVSLLDGSMSYEERAAAVSEFNSNPAQFVFLISTKAGGVGLNIASANKVVIIDPNWNPAYDLQAQDRAYRIGQTRDVEVFRLVSAGTIEEIVYARQIYKQQQANIGYNASTERRYFKGVQEKSDQKGEIFGLTNLFKFHPSGVLLRDIVNNTNVAEARAGVSAVEIAVEQDQDLEANASDDAEDAFISQLAASVAKGSSSFWKDDPQKEEKKRKPDPVSAILATAGVEYTHENSEVIGSSKIENQLSRRAEEAGNEVELGQGFVFERSSQVCLEEDLGEGLAPKQLSKYKYRPPQDVKDRQFCSMAKLFGYEDAVEFAVLVEGWTQNQRRDCLERFYSARRQMLDDIIAPEN